MAAVESLLELRGAYFGATYFGATYFGAAGIFCALFFLIR
jgi:hypothetical protein